MTTSLHSVQHEEPADAIQEFSLADVLRAREDGVDFRTAASMFAGAVEHFESKGHNLYRRMLLQPSDAEALVDYPREAGERRMIILASNNYLGLASHPKVIDAACRAAVQYGTGAGSSPLLVGTFPTTRKLETKLAQFKGAEDACVFATGYSANVGVISAFSIAWPTPAWSMGRGCRAHR
jgi:7-keto-8-aminopelargonate synthetase-like enzyme